MRLVTSHLKNSVIILSAAKNLSIYLGMVCEVPYLARDDTFDEHL